MSSAPALTVAIPTYNGAQHLAEALRGILGQEGAEFELLLVDDRSDDETLNVARREAGDRIRIETNSERLGLAGNWNRCVALTSTPWVAIFHQDDVMRPGHLRAHQAISGFSNMGLVCSATEVIDDAGQPVDGARLAPNAIGTEDRIYQPGAFLPELASSNPVRCSAVTMNVEAHRAAGGFNHAYRYVVDWEFWLRIAERHNVAWLAKPTVAVRWHAGSETHRFKRGCEDLDEAGRLLETAYASALAALPNAREMRKAARGNLARAYLNRAYEAVRNGDSALARRCVRCGVGLSPRLLARLAFEPRLLAKVVMGGSPRETAPTR